MNNERIIYLLRVAHDFLKLNSYTQAYSIFYDGAEGEGSALLADIAIELGLDDGPYDYALPETKEYEEGLYG